MKSVRYPRGSLLAAAMLGLVLGVVAWSSVAGQESAQEPEAPVAATDPVVEFQRQALQHWLEVALGVKDPCEGVQYCASDTDFARIVSGLVLRCQKVAPSSIRARGEFSPEFDSHLVQLERSCSALEITAASLGTPDFRADWVDAARDALSEVSPGDNS